MAVLPFSMQGQLKSNWCWAAVAASVSAYYHPGAAWAQCDVANSNLGRSDCCGTPPGDPCNVTSVLDVPLGIVGCFDRMVGTATSQVEIITEVGAGRPLCIRVQWSDGGGHFLSAIGYVDDADSVDIVDDPIYGRTFLLHSVLRTAYQGSGTWTHTYYTRD
ncbi:papain-like cysteine protease family protein [Streptomyces sp. NPDC000594]|uniref:papain-like cysteine protease family protein n=1 Tax=Streptomyces sp. NPDC000594 TaxID=3154261 RepID=UPI0033252EAE